MHASIKEHVKSDGVSMSTFFGAATLMPFDITLIHLVRYRTYGQGHP